LWIGGLFLALSTPIHLFRVWDDYPVWYHLLYLTYIVPLAWLGGRLVVTDSPTPTPANAPPNDRQRAAA
jgi:hypothetical protein